MKNLQFEDLLNVLTEEQKDDLYATLITYLSNVDTKNNDVIHEFMSSFEGDMSYNS